MYKEYLQDETQTASDTLGILTYEMVLFASCWLTIISGSIRLCSIETYLKYYPLKKPIKRLC